MCVQHPCFPSTHSCIRIPPFILLFPSLPLTSQIPAETIRSVLQSFRFIFRPSTRRWLQSWLSTHTPEVRLTLPGYGQPDSRGQLSRAVCSDASNNVVVPSASFVIEWFDPLSRRRRWSKRFGQRKLIFIFSSRLWELHNYKENYKQK